MKKFSLTSFLIGLLAGVILTASIIGILTAIGVNSLSTKQVYSDNVLNRLVDQVISNREFVNSKSAYGKVLSHTGDEIVIEASHQGEKMQTTFTYDGSTRFYTYARDDESSEIQINPQNITVGDEVSVTAGDAINWDGVQPALTILKI